MKPRKLVMEGFGPFLEKTEIDFTGLDDGLTLITGNTGAGKTTIFDAICCALFGDTSGGKRSFSEMRSKAAGPKDKTRIEFEFELRGETYTIERYPSYTREKTRGSGTTTAGARAYFYLPGDGGVIEKPNNVTEAVIKLLGIKRQEFRQIVMIAQNEFMGMIVGTDTEQEKTFNRIFGADLYREFDKRVHEERLKLDEIYEGSLEKLRMLLSDFVDQEVVSIKEDELEIIESELSSLKEEAVKAVDEYTPEYERLKELLQAANLDLEKGRQIDKDFKTKESLEANYAKLKKREEEIRGLTARKKRAERARDKLEIPATQLEDLKRRSDEKTREYQKKRVEFLEVKKDKEASEEYLKSFSEERMQELIQSAADLESQIDKYKSADRVKQDLKIREERLEKIENKKTEEEKEIKSLEEFIDKTKIRADSDFLVKDEINKSREGRLESSRGRIDAILSDVGKIVDHLRQYQVLQEEVEDLYTAVTIAKDRYDRALKNYMSESAAFLAQKLEVDRPCPVCGSIEHPNPAEISDEIVSVRDLEEIQHSEEETRNRFNKKAKERDQVKSRVGNLVENIEKSELSEIVKENLDREKITVFLEDVDRVLENKPNDIKEDHLELDTELKRVRDYLNKELEIVKKEQDKNKLQKEENDAKKIKVEKAKEKLGERNKTHKETLSEYDKAKSSVERVASSLETISGELTLGSYENAKKVLDERITKRDDYKRRFDAAKENQKQQKENYDRIISVGKKLKEEKDKLETEVKKREKDFTERLGANGFNTQSYSVARADISKIEEIKECLDEYHNNCLRLEERISSIKETLSGVVRPNIGALEESKRNREEQEKEGAKKLRQLEMKRDNIEKTKREVEKLIPKVGKNRDKRDSIARLDGVVNKKGENFTQYVLSSFFSQVLERANLKLERMTDGLYRLRQPKKGKLGVEVYDSNTNATRDIKTLSGGETFMASLALALGFSEIVEEQNGGVRLDTIFIDEGFGSLDPDYLDRALRVLNELTGDRRVAIISHVELLKERIPQQIIVTKDNESSHVQVVKC